MPRTTLRIAQPCTESWADMTPTATGRHCAACQKTVVNFTHKTDAEILAYLASASGETCGRLWSDQQNRPLVSQLPARTASRWRTWLATALALWGTRESLGATAHAAPPASHHSPTKAPKSSQPARAAKRLHGTVRDAATHEPLAGVAIFLKGENRTATTDSGGRFSLRLPAGRPTGSRRRLVLHRACYLSRQLPLTPAPGGGQLELALHADPAAAGVEVVAQYQEQKRWVMGGAVSLVVGADEPPTTQPAARAPHGFFHWLTRPFRRS
jgi:hypothetical protein